MADFFVECIVKSDPKQCRVCLFNVGELPIFGDEKQPDISEEVTTFGNIELIKDDDLPKCLCKDCFKLLEGAVLFRKSAIRTDAFLKQRGKKEMTRAEFVLDSVKLENTIYPLQVYTDNNILEHDYPSKLEERQMLDIKNEKVDYFDENDRFDDDDDDEDDMVLMMLAKNKVKTEKHECKICKMTFQSLEEIKKHKLTRNHKKNKCIIIPKKKCNTKLNLKRKESPLTSDKDQKCELCDKLLSREYYPRHMTAVHKIKSKLSPKTKQCPTCKKMFRPDYIGRHMRHVHADDKKSRYVKPFTCEICNKKFTENMFPRHVREVHKIKPNMPTKRKACPICKKMFRPDYIVRHMRTIHAGERKQKLRVECPICNKHFTQEYYPIHAKKHDEGNKEYICDVCGKEFTFQSAFANHKLIHTNELPYKCDHCPYRGRSKHLLRIHTRTHTGDYPYKCDHCNIQCITKSNLNRHMLRHRGPVDYQCDSCNRGFYTKLELERHITAIHLGIKSHICNICGAAFGYKHGMKKHMHKVHKIKGTGRKNAVYLKLQNEVIP